jgi:hypothetical protein
MVTDSYGISQAFITYIYSLIDYEKIILNYYYLLLLLLLLLEVGGGWWRLVDTHRIVDRWKNELLSTECGC